MTLIESVFQSGKHERTTAFANFQFSTLTFKVYVEPSETSMTKLFWVDS